MRSRHDTEVLAILERLEGRWDRVFVCPLVPADVDSLEQRLGIRLPNSFRTYLEKVGVLQDLVERVFESEVEYIAEREFIREVARSDSSSLFAIAADGYGNLLAMKDADSQDEQLYKISHSSGQVKARGITFKEFLDKAVTKAIKSYAKRTVNRRKSWCVQFSFDGSEPDVLGMLADVLRVHFDVDWSNPERSEAGVLSCTRPFMFGGKNVDLAKLSCDEWDAEMFFFDLHECAADLLHGSIIQRLHGAFHERCAGSSSVRYKLINYGILATDEP